MTERALSYLTPEARARVHIDEMLEQAGWAVQDGKRVNLAAARGVAVREFVLKAPHGRADYLLFVDRTPVGVAEAKDADVGLPWTLARAGQPIFTMPRAAVIRSMVLNHLIHHRAHLCVYLRLNDVPVPGMYGPSGDE